MAVRSLLARVARLEQARVSPWAAVIGTPEHFAAECQRGVDEGRLDGLDMPALINAVTRWTSEVVWR